MTVWVVHFTDECDSDTGHTTYYKSRIVEVFSQKGDAEFYVRQRRKTNPLLRITEREVV